jgi:hypothetical protein
MFAHGQFGGQTSLCDWSCMVWIIVMIIMTIGTIIPTKHSYGKDHMCLWRTFEKQKKMHGTSHYTNYGWGGSLLMGYLYLFAWASFCVCSIPLGFPHHFTCLLRTHTHVHVLSTQFQLTFCLCPHASPYQSTPNPHLKKIKFIGLWTLINCDFWIRHMFISL